MPATTMTPSEANPRKSIRWGRIALYVFLTAMSVLWLLPLVWAVYTSLRTFGDTEVNGYFSLPAAVTLQNFFDAVRGKAKLNCPAEIGYESAVSVLKVNEAIEAKSRLAFKPEDFRI